MAVSPWVRLWLPLGNAFLLIAILDTAELVRNELKDIGIFLYQGLSQDHVDISEFYSTPEIIFLTISIAIRLLATIGFLWIGTVLKGNRRSLLVWIVTTVILSIGLTIFLLINAFNPPHAIDKMHAWSIAYSFCVFVIFNGYALFIACVTYQAMGRQELLHPIGKGLLFLWEFFSNETKTAATFFLTSEIVLDSNYLISRQFMQFFGVPLIGHEGDRYPPIVVEEIILRVIRIVVNAAGLWLVQKEKRRVLRWWSGLTFLLILVSTGIFIVLTVLWRGEDISSTLAYFLMFPGHLLYRFITLYFVLKYTRADFSSFVL